MKGDEKRIFEMLVTEATNPQVGLAAVRAAADRFLRLGLKSISKPDTKRRVSSTTTFQLWTKQKGICARCRDTDRLMRIQSGKPTPEDATYDAIQPAILGGKHQLSNARVVHRRCNSSKGDNDIITESKKTGMLMTEIYGEE